MIMQIFHSLWNGSKIHVWSLMDKQMDSNHTPLNVWSQWESIKSGFHACIMDI